jgi:hypothetical protein
MVAFRLELFHHDQGRKEFANFVGALGESIGIFSERGPFAAAMPRDEFLRQDLDRVAFRTGAGHDRAL